MKTANNICCGTPDPLLMDPAYPGAIRPFSK